MADITFPGSPANGDTFTSGNRTWQYTSTKNAWFVVGDTASALTQADVVDEDDMTSDSSSLVPTQQSVKAYVDANVVTAGVSTVNGAAGAVVIDPDDLVDTATTNKFATQAQLDKLDNIIGILEYAISDETSPITVGDNKLTVRAPFAFTITDIRASVATASTSGKPTFSVKEGGTNVCSTDVNIDANEKTSVTAAVPVVISDASVADDAELTFGVVTSGTGTKGAKIRIYYTR